ncbi:hypothetical protein ABZT03_43770 [Streptomyces sp. NPDC005574]|uniref:hypothetical protein n=1 Tax=Streptomyces sp. NPDC005574 TaxID=3156891 RepID=UPI0033A9CE90
MAIFLVINIHRRNTIMSMKRRLMAVTAISTVVAGTAVVGTAQAATTQPVSSVAIADHQTIFQSTAYLRDDDSVFGPSYSYASGPVNIQTFTRNFPTGERVSVCAGNEVHASMRMTTKRISDSTVQVSLTPKLYEGSTCFSDDLDGYLSSPLTFTMRVGETVKGSLTLNNIEENSGDRVIFNYTVQDFREL